MTNSTPPLGTSPNLGPDALDEDENPIGLVPRSEGRRPPAGRYGPEPTPLRRRLAIAGIVAAALVGIAVTVWIGLGQAATPVRYDDFGFKVVSSEQIDVTFQVSMKPGTQAECTIDALADSYAQVGTVKVVVGPSDKLEGRYTVSVATSELATTGIVESCVALP
ncbi:DUF4307 domain-containing protein [Oerskovia enterophila]